VLQTLDAAAVRRWCGGGLAALRAHQHEIDELNVYPVPDGDTGTNLVLTLTSAHEALDEPEPPDSPGSPLDRAMRRMARGALLGARGNSGVIVSQILRGMADTFAGVVAVRGGELARALRTATEAAYGAVARPVEGTVLSVVAAAADGAGKIASDDLVVVARAAARSAAEALARTPQQLPALARAGVVDAGGRGLCLLLDALVDALNGITPTDAQIATTSPAASALPETPAEPPVTPAASARSVTPAAAAATSAAATPAGSSALRTPHASPSGVTPPATPAAAALPVTAGTPDAAPAKSTADAPAGQDADVLPNEAGATVPSAAALPDGRSGTPGTGGAGMPTGGGAGTPTGGAGMPTDGGAGMPTGSTPSGTPTQGVPAGTAPDGVLSGPHFGGLHGSRLPVETPPTALDEGPSHFEYEVQYLLDAEAGTIETLRRTLDALGDSLVVVGTGEGDPPTWNVHVHVDDIGAAIEAGIAAGRPRQISVTRLEDRVPADRNRRADDRLPNPDGRGAVVVAAGDGLTALFEAEGATVVGRNPSTAEMLAAIESTGAGHIVLLPNDANTHAVATSAAREAAAGGIRVSVVPTRSPVQALAALAVRDPRREFADDVIAMAEAAGACRYGEVCTASREALTVAGRCRPGDLLGLVDGEVHIIGAGLEEVCRRLLDRMLGGGGELVTLVLGAGAPLDLEETLTHHATQTWPFVELQCYTGGQPRYHLLVGVE
jgi:fatty acid kinase